MYCPSFAIASSHIRPNTIQQSLCTIGGDADDAVNGDIDGVDGDEVDVVVVVAVVIVVVVAVVDDDDAGDTNPVSDKGVEEVVVN